MLVSTLVKKTDFSTKVTEIECKIPNVSGFLLTSVFNSKITELENKIPDIKNLASKTEVTAIENKTFDVSSLFKKTDYSEEITKIKNDYVTTAALDARHKDLIQKATFDSETNDLERDASYFTGKNHFGDDGMQNYFVFQLVYKYLKRVADSTDKNIVYVHYWQSKGISDGKIIAPGTSSRNDMAPILEETKMRLKFKNDLLRQNKVTYNHGKIVNIYIVYEISSIFTSQSTFTPKNSLFGAVKLTKNSDISKYKYSGYGICFDSNGRFLHADGTYGVNLIIFRVDLSSSVYANNRNNNILVLGKEFIQGINGTAIYAEKMYTPNFTVYGKKIV